MPALSAAAQEKNFRSVAPVYMRTLLSDFPTLEIEDAAAMFGNFGHESKGLTDDQEDKPTVAGSRGGLNWAQWTGARRRAMEAYCKRNGIDLTSDIAAYKWLWNELKSTEKAALAALAKAVGLEAKTVAFERSYLRSGVKHDDMRLRWAQIALDAFGKEYPDGSHVTEPADDEPDAALPAGPDAPNIPVVVDVPPVASSHPSWIAIVVIAVLAAGVAYVVNRWGLMTAEDISTDRAVSLFGESGFRDVWGDILRQAALAFVAPLIGAAATAGVSWVTYWWARWFKADFDAKSADTLHKAFERAMLAAIQAFGPGAKKTTLISAAADYMETFNPDAAKKLGRERLEALALPHLATAKASMSKVD